MLILSYHLFITEDEHNDTYSVFVNNMPVPIHVPNEETGYENMLKVTEKWRHVFVIVDTVSIGYHHGCKTLSWKNLWKYLEIRVLKGFG